MTHTLKHIDASTVDLRVEFGKAELHEFIDAAEQYFAGQVTIDGFRAGKAPKDLVRQRVGEHPIREEALQRAVGKSMDTVAEAEHFDIVDQTDFVIDKNNEDSFSYSVRLVIIPELHVGKYKDMQIARKSISITDDEIDTVIQDIQHSHTEFHAIDRPVEKGDRVEINFSLANKGVVVEGGDSHNHPVIIGQNTLVPGFEDHIVGLRAGEKKLFSISIPADYYQKTIAGKTLDVDLELISVQNPQMPELTDEFAKKLGKFTSVSNLRENIKKGLTAEKEAKEHERIQLEIMDNIMKTPFDVPALLVDRQLDALLDNFDHSLHGQGMELGLYLAHVKKTQEELRESWRPQAERQVKINLILRAVAREEKIEVEEKDENGALLREKIFSFLETHNVVV